MKLGAEGEALRSCVALDEVLGGREEAENTEIAGWAWLALAVDAEIVVEGDANEDWRGVAEKVRENSQCEKDHEIVRIWEVAAAEGNSGVDYEDSDHEIAKRGFTQEEKND